MNKTSVIIPSRSEPFLQKTVDSILDNFREEVEIIVVLDGEQNKLKEDKRVKVIQSDTHQGMRQAINNGLIVADGKYLMKIDSHCMIAPDFDIIMKENFEENWLVVPRRHELDEIEWQKKRLIFDYEYITYPLINGCLEVKRWDERHIERANYEIDDKMIFQGSCWFVDREYFIRHVGLLDIKHYGEFAHEPLEIGLKYWLGGGEIKVNKKTWYAHLAKRKRHYKTRLYDRSYKRTEDVGNAIRWSTDHWLHNKEMDMIHPFSWLVEKFWPVPTWPENWKEQLYG